jgi:MarR family transcriptional regulator, organic hydroperoxide resistance regulator
LRVLLSLTPGGRRKVEALFPRFNAEEVRVVTALSEEEQEQLASMRRVLYRRVESGAADGATRYEPGSSKSPSTT